MLFEFYLPQKLFLKEWVELTHGLVKKAMVIKSIEPEIAASGPCRTCRNASVLSHMTRSCPIVQISTRRCKNNKQLVISTYFHIWTNISLSNLTFVHALWEYNDYSGKKLISTPNKSHISNFLLVDFVHFSWTSRPNLVTGRRLIIPHLFCF